jgi:transcription-repair coupling factor (superfamily II helicase)
VEVQVRLDFLPLTPVEENRAEPATNRANAQATRRRRPINAGVIDEIELTEPPESSAPPVSSQAAAYIPFSYVSDSRQRIEIYRKLAQATDKAALAQLSKECRDRFGPLPEALQLLLLVAELKSLAAARGITGIEVKEDKLMLMRNQDYVMVGSKFPRLQKKGPAARLKEIRTLLLAL